LFSRHGTTFAASRALVELTALPVSRGLVAFEGVSGSPRRKEREEKIERRKGKERKQGRTPRNKFLVTAL